MLPQAAPTARAPPGTPDRSRHVAVAARLAAGDALQLAPDAELERGAPDVERELLTRHLAVDTPQHLGDGGRERGIVALDRGGGRELEPEVLLERGRLGAERDPADAPLGRGDDQHAERAACHRERDRRAGPARAVRRRRHAEARVGLLVEPAARAVARGVERAGDVASVAQLGAQPVDAPGVGVLLR